jgi:hypothetical protein
MYKIASFYAENISQKTIDNLFDEYLNILMKTFLLLYADDTLLFSETYEGMQNLLNVFSDYCKLWKLEVNLSKTKTVIFSKRKFRPPLRLKLDGKELEYTDCFFLSRSYFLLQW